MKYWIIYDQKNKKMYSLPNRTGVKGDKGEQLYDDGGIVVREITSNELFKRCKEEGLDLDSGRFQTFETNNSTALPIYAFKKEEN